MVKIDNPEEILDLVDSQDTVIGTIERARIPEILDGKSGYVRAADAFIVNDKGELWIPRRVSTKRLLPNGFDFSCSEHVGSGETYEEAVVRGFKEELDDSIVTSGLVYLGKTQPRPGMPYFEAIFAYHSNEVPKFNTQDFASYEWLKPGELLQRLERGEIGKAALTEAVKMLQTHPDFAQTDI